LAITVSRDPQTIHIFEFYGNSSLYLSRAKNSRRNRVITFKGTFKLLDTSDKEFHKMAQTFSTRAEYTSLKGDTDHNTLPDAGQSPLEQAFDSTHDAKEVLVYLCDPNKTASIDPEPTSA
jgi:hypothetical protein